MHFAIFLILPSVIAALHTPLKRSSPAPLLKSRDAEHIEGSYIVKLKSDAANVDAFLASQNLQPNLKYYDSFRGFAAKLADNQVKELQDHPDVDWMEQDVVMKDQSIVEPGDDSETPIVNQDSDSDTFITDSCLDSKCWGWGRKKAPPIPRPSALNPEPVKPRKKKPMRPGKKPYRRPKPAPIPRPERPERPGLSDVAPVRPLPPPPKNRPRTRVDIQKDAPWNLARISNRLPYQPLYMYHSNAGARTCSYILDSGVDCKHPELRGHCRLVVDFTPVIDHRRHTDESGHGTLSAGIIGAKTYGVAKNTYIYGIKITNEVDIGSLSATIAGLDFVTRDISSRRCPAGAVVNMSVVGTFSKLVNFAAKKITDKGIFVAAAAGNSADDASKYSPGSEPTVCTVGATTRDDQLARFSNYGRSINVLAPGAHVTSTFLGRGYGTYSGTSPASAHVAGLGAYLLGEGHNAQTLCQHITSMAIRGVINMRNHPKYDKGLNTPNLLINNGFK